MIMHWTLFDGKFPAIRSPLEIISYWPWKQKSMWYFEKHDKP